MIKAELRIGNMIRDIESGDIGTVSRIGENMCSVKILHTLTQNYDKFELIPLSEEWLVKFGFERHDEGSVSAQFSYGVNPVTHDYLIYLKWIKDYKNDYCLKGFPFYLNGDFEITSVHQLQNLVHSLTGEELTLKQEG